MAIRYEWDAFVSLTTDLAEAEAEALVVRALDAINKDPDGPRVSLDDSPPYADEEAE